MEAMAQDPDVEAVYIATVHTYHKPLAEVFLASHNKHVLVENPAFTNLGDWLGNEKALAEQNGVCCCSDEDRRSSLSRAYSIFNQQPDYRLIR